MRLGVIADDFTGATDIASFLVQNGMATVQVSGKCLEDIDSSYLNDVDAVVVSLKSRSCHPEKAVTLSLQALKWLKKQGAEKIFFKYCSTFDSTEEGNIGPVADALLEAMGEPFAVVSPALPINLRTVYKGNLFVGDLLLHESPMKNHPLNPMCDSNLVRLMERQSRYKAGLIELNTIRKGEIAIAQRLVDLQNEGVRYVISDALSNEDLSLVAKTIWQKCQLFTGGSGFGGALARQMCHSEKSVRIPKPSQGSTVILSGSCSQATLCQVNNYQKSQHPCFLVDVLECARDHEKYVLQVVQWFEQQDSGLAPLIYVSSSPRQVQQTQKKLGVKNAQEVLENFFAAIAKELSILGIQNFIVAGGETSGVVAQSLRILGFLIGKQISPGVPWVQSLDRKYFLALKSGNFGSDDFFTDAISMIG